MRAVLDANVLISGLLWPGIPQLCILAADAGLYELVSADAILDEVREKLIQKFGNTPEESDESITGLRNLATLVQVRGQCGWVPADPDDDKFIEAAIVADAEIIVSGDRHLLQLKTIAGIEVLTPRAFLVRLAKES